MRTVKGEADPVEEQLLAYNARDIDRFVACYGENVKAFNLTSAEPLFEGRENLRRRYTEVFADNPKLHCEIKSRMRLGAFSIDEEWVTGVVAAPQGIHVSAIYFVADGLIQTIWFTR